MIDTHCHLSLDDNLDEIINQMQGNIIVISGTNDETNREVLEICSRYQNVYGTIGIHPEDVDNYSNDSIKFIEENINNEKIIGIGEIGLDYHYTKDNIMKQKELFVKQLLLAKKYNMPVVIHSRDAINDTYEIIKQCDIKKFDIHCFSSSLEMAKKFIELGGFIGIGGVLTFKNSIKLRDIVKNISLNNILLETDSPYLSPEPLRGKVNVPYNIIYVAKKISEIKGIDVDEVLKITKLNSSRLFDLDMKM